jgi:hypothetical protein
LVTSGKQRRREKEEKRRGEGLKMLRRNENRET